MLLRGHHANPWDLRPWELVADRFDIRCLRTKNNEYDVESLSVSVQAVRLVGDRLPPGRAGRATSYAIGDRYEWLENAVQGADIVHSAELHSWFSAQAAGLRERPGFRLALRFGRRSHAGERYRWIRERQCRRTVLAAADSLCRRASVLGVR